MVYHFALAWRVALNPRNLPLSAAVLCRDQAKRLWDQRAEFEALGVQLVCVVHEWIQREVRARAAARPPARLPAPLQGPCAGASTQPSPAADRRLRAGLLGRPHLPRRGQGALPGAGRGQGGGRAARRSRRSCRRSRCSPRASRTRSSACSRARRPPTRARRPRPQVRTGGLLSMLNPFSAAWRRIREAQGRVAESNLVGDGSVLGGMLVVRAGEGGLVHMSREESFGEYAPLEEVLADARKAAAAR